MENLTTQQLRRKRTSLTKKLISITPDILRGSLIERYKRCGKKGCKCLIGPGHGPKYYLSVSLSGQRPQMDYIPLNYHKQAEQFVANYKQVREILEEICNINRELLRRRERL